MAGVVVLAFSIAPNPKEPVDDGDPFTGRWLLNGVDALDVEYSGTLTIVAAGDGYELHWLVTGGIRVGTGTGRGGRLVAGWSATRGLDPERGGTAVYLVDADGTLRGTTTIDGVSGSGTEEGFAAG